MKNVLFICCIICPLISFSQSDVKQLPNCEIDSIDGMKILQIVGSPPEYKEGFSGLYKEIKKNLRVSENAKIARSLENFYISFVVDTSGVTRNFCITEDLEILDGFFEKVNKWNPGFHEGKKVPVRMSLPIHIRFSE